MNDQTIEQEIQDKGLTAPRITPADIEEHIAAGKRPVKLAVNYEDRISFTLTEAGHLKRIKILDLATEDADGADEAFDGESAVNAAEITRAIQALRHALYDKDDKDENGQAKV